MSSSLDCLREKLLNYKAGDFLKQQGVKAFPSATPAELSNMSIRIGLFGSTGAGKSSFVNSVAKSLNDRKPLPAVTQSGDQEGTISLETFFHDYGFRLVDTRGFMSMESLEERELFAILYGYFDECENIERANAPDFGVGGSNVVEDQLSKQIHVVLWFIKSTDVRLQEETYQKKIEFVKHHLFTLGVSVIPVVTFAEQMNPDQKGTLTDKAKKLFYPTAPKSQDVYFVSNYLPEQSSTYDKMHQENVLKLVENAIFLGEKSLRTRQIKRATMFNDM